MNEENIYYVVLSCDDAVPYEKEYKSEAWALKKAKVMMRAGLEMVVVNKFKKGVDGILDVWMFNQEDYD